MDFMAKGGVKASKQAAVQASRRDRQETTVRIRKAKKEGLLKAKRLENGAAAETGTPPSNTNNTMTDTEQVLKHPRVSDSQVLNKARMVFESHQANPAVVPLDAVLETIKAVRRLICRPDKPPFELLVQMGFVPYFVRFLQMTEHHDLVFEAEWVLTNIASSKFAPVVVDSGALPFLAKNLMHGEPSIRDQAAWCFGNIAGEGPQYRNYLLSQQDVVRGLIENLTKPDSLVLLTNVAWAISGLCRDNPPFDAIQPFIAPLANALAGLKEATMETDKARIDIMWALSYVAADKRGLKALVELGAAPVLVDIVARMPMKTLLIPTVRTIGNIAVGDDEDTDCILAAGYLEHVPALMSHPSNNIKKDTCWTLSNIIAGSLEQIKMVFQHGRNCEIVKELVKIALHGAHEVRKEATYAICSIVESGSKKEIYLLFKVARAMEVFVDAIKPSADIALLEVIMSTLKQLFERSKHIDMQYIDLFINRGGLEPLEELQSHPNEDIYQLAVSMIETYFTDDEDERNQNLAPDPAGGTFTFGISKELFPASPIPLTFGTSTTNQ